MSDMMNTDVETDSVLKSQGIVSSDNADAEHTTEVEVLDHTAIVKGVISENYVPGNKAHMCDPCVIDESENRACAFCIVCVEYLCESCYREHKKYKATRGHKVLKDTIPADPRIFKYIRKIMMCSVHEETEVTHRCEDHNIYVCVLCTAGIHRKCETVVELSESYTHSEKRASDVQMKINELKEKNHRISVTQNSNILDLTTEKKDIIETVSSFTSDLLEMKNKLVNEADMMTEEHLKSLKDDAAKCTSFEDEYNLFREVVETVEQYGTKTETNMLLTVIQEKLELTEQEIEKQQNREEIHLFYIRNKHMSALQNLGTFELKCKKSTNDGGNVCEKITESDVAKDNTQSAKEIPTLAVEQFKITDDESKKDEVFSIKVGNEFYDCSISGCVVLDDGTIVIIDGENRSIKVFDTSYKFIYGEVNPEPPSDICVTEEYKLAVVYKVLKRIRFFEWKENKLLTIREIPTKYDNRQITARCTSKRLALVCITNYTLRGFIQIREFSG
ncbi:E3 ubiquitin-protein ligase TRIM36-like [Mercenaria mercenaria]|uniref:E3 ubiquitin-protein ligase TRIM36-like n=1 Tax=Mercenaria mercenaria TaxID=6596 RepID=UPI00234F97F9|nr:E3 ubiquitin-protein ligase TRIM36-like [Mercenaria mercenaria]